MPFTFQLTDERFELPSQADMWQTHVRKSTDLIFSVSCRGPIVSLAELLEHSPLSIEVSAREIRYVEEARKKQTSTASASAAEYPMEVTLFYAAGYRDDSDFLSSVKRWIEGGPATFAGQILRGTRPATFVIGSILLDARTTPTSKMNATPQRSAALSARSADGGGAPSRRTSITSRLSSTTHSHTNNTDVVFSGQIRSTVPQHMAKLLQKEYALQQAQLRGQHNGRVNSELMWVCSALITKMRPQDGVTGAADCGRLCRRCVWVPLRIEPMGSTTPSYSASVLPYGVMTPELQERGATSTTTPAGGRGETSVGASSAADRGVTQINTTTASSSIPHAAQVFKSKFVKLLTSAEHSDQLRQRFHSYVAGGASGRVCPYRAARMTVPIRLPGGMYHPRSRNFVSFLADAQLLTAMLRDQAASASTARAFSTGGTASLSQNAEQQVTTKAFLSPQELINVLLICCRPIAVLQHVISKISTAFDHRRTASGGAARAVRSSSFAAAGSSRHPSLFSAPKELSHVLPWFTIIKELGASSSQVESTRDSSSAYDPHSDSPESSMFLIDWYDFLLLSTVEAKGWHRVLIPLVDRYYQYPLVARLLDPAQSLVGHLSSTLRPKQVPYATWTDILDHMLYVAEGLRPENVSPESFRTLFSEHFPLHDAEGTPRPSSPLVTAAAKRRMMMLEQHRDSLWDTDGLQRGSHAPPQLHPLHAQVDPTPSLLPWQRLFYAKPTSYPRSGAGAGGGGGGGARSKLSFVVTPCRILVALLSQGQLDWMTRVVNPEHPHPLLVSEVQAMRNLRMDPVMDAMEDANLVALTRRYYQKWLLNHRQRKELLRKRMVVLSNIQRKMETRYLLRCFRVWMEFNKSRKSAQVQSEMNSRVFL